MKRIVLAILIVLIMSSEVLAVAHVSATPMPIMKPVKELKLINK